jgi:hypothetical protein
MDPNGDSDVGGTKDATTAKVGRPLTPLAQKAVCRLLEAHDYAHDAGRELWEFAVSIAELRNDGVTKSDLRWLICRRYVEYATEVTTMASVKREFVPVESLRISKRAAFVITSAGLELRKELEQSSVGCHDSAQGGTSLLPEVRPPVPERKADQPSNGQALVSPQYPKWDRDRRELRVGNQLVKVFKLPSPMQERILMAFEEESWPPRIDDPLPNCPDLLPKRRLHDTIKSLNRNQKNCLVRFMGDGTGEGIRWEFVSQEAIEQSYKSCSGEAQAIETTYGI